MHKESTKTKKAAVLNRDEICVMGARVHNLRDIDATIPRNKLVVITGLSGSGKSSLAFDTIYAEGQRRYLDSFSAYARQFIGSMERPDVDKISGLSPVVSIEQKSTNKNPRSTVGTITEIYDFLRLLYARASDAYSHESGKKMVRFTEEQILDSISDRLEGKKVIILAPLIRGRKGHYRELFEQMRKRGFLKVRVDGETVDMGEGMKLDRYKIHDIELVVDRIEVNEASMERLRSAVDTALKMGSGLMYVLDHETDEEHQYSSALMCPDSGISYEDPSPNSFSFNSPYGACQNCNGLGFVHEVNHEVLVPDPKKSINQGGIAPLGEYRDNYLFRQLKKLARKYSISLSSPVSDLPEEVLNIILYGGKEKGQKENALVDDTDDKWYTLSKGGLTGMLKRCFRATSSDSIRRWAEEFMERQLCPSCHGYRLKQESYYFRIDGRHIGELVGLDMNELQEWFSDMESRMSEKQNLIAKDVLKEIRSRIGFLLDVGLEYLTLDRATRSLSGGEAQRIRLATQIGSKLTGVTYILDEPSIGLHQRDNQRLIGSLKQLTKSHNTVIVVEHDKDIMLESEYIIDLGPGAGVHGGRIVAEGTPEQFLKASSSTAEYLSGRKNIEIPKQRRPGNGNVLSIRKASGNNLKEVDVDFPLGQFICVTGVSGSGKSSLINETIYPILNQHFYRSRKKPLAYGSVKGLEELDKVIEIDQSPIGRTPRSNPVTYTKVFDEIRQLFAQMPEAKIRGYKPGRFSFNVKGGRCEECQGAGWKVIEMNFLPDVLVKCEKCMGKRYNRETLDVRYKGKSISDVLNMNVEEAVHFFEGIPSLHRRIKTLMDVGLGYITLGQSSTTLSGGEAQRIKLAAELGKKDTGRTFYILDEPTTGLHFEDIRMLLDVLNRLVERGNTVLVIEHNLDVVKMCDHIIDLGPEGGHKGGRIVAQGTPEAVAASKTGHTARFLADELAR